MRVLTLPVSLWERFAELDEAAQLAQGLQLAGISAGLQLASSPLAPRHSAQLSHRLSSQQQAWLSEMFVCVESSEPWHKLGRIIS